MGKSISKIITPIVEAATLAIAPEAAPFLLPAEGAIGGLAGGGGLKGALLGGAEGLIGGQLGGTGTFAPFSSGGQSLGSQILGGIGSSLGFGGAAGGASGAGGLIEPASGLGGVASGAGSALSGATAAGAGAGGAAAALPSFTSNAPLDFSNLGENATPSLGQGIGTGAGGGLSDLVTGSAPAVQTGGAADSLLGGTTLGQFTPQNAGAVGTASGAAAPAAKAGGGALDFLKQYGGTALNAAGLAKAALSPSKIPQQGNLESQAAQLDATGKQLTSALQTGQLPPGAENAIKQGVEAQKANIRSQFASMGLSGSSSEIQALNQVEQQAAAQKFQIANSLLQSGLNATGQANTVYNQLAHYKLQQDQQLQDALASFANSLAGGSNRVAA